MDHDIKLDLERAARIGFDEAIFCSGKSVGHVARILEQAQERGLRLLLTRCKLYVEGSGAAATAALLAGKVSLAPGAHVVALVSGGNVDLDKVAALA